MRVADGWTDYQLLDTSGGEKLESWGGTILVRPDPQIIWDTPRSVKEWKTAHAVYHRSEKGGGSWEKKRDFPPQWQIRYKELTFLIRPTGFKHTGLFPEQAVNWDWAQKKITEANRPIRVLNLFAYTGGATLACAAAGASVCHVDASKGMVQWARENASVSGLSDKPIRWIVDDCEKFLAREIRRESRYDAIILDPPSYGRGPTGEIFKLEDHIYALLELCVEILSDKPLFLILNSYTTGLSAGVMEYLLSVVMKKRFTGSVSAGEIGLETQSTGYPLPCGVTALWQAE